MPNNAEIAKNAIDDFKKIQDYMAVAKEENATKTYAKLKDEYLSLKAILNVLGVNLTDIDKIKEWPPRLKTRRKYGEGDKDWNPPFLPRHFYLSNPP